MFRALVFGVFLVIVFPAPASALVVFERPASREIVAVHDDGSSARVVAHGYGAVVSPDGRRVAYMGVQGGQPSGQARLVGTRGGRSRLLARDATTGAYWSPNGRYVVVGRHVDNARLIVDGAWLNDVVHRRRRYVDLIGNFSRAGFSPNSAIALIAYDAVDVENTLELRIGHRGVRDVDAPTLPLWGRRGLAYYQDNGDRYASATYSEVIFARRLGGRTRLLAGTGAFPVAWSADGTRLLVEEATRTVLFRAVLFSPATGTQQTLATPLSTISALSRDGRHVLGHLHGNVVSEGLDGKIKILAHHAANPSWTQ